MDLTGVSLKFKSKRVDKIILRHGFNANEVFHSPITGWFVGLFLLLMLIIPSFLGAILYHVIMDYLIETGLTLLIYNIICYLVIIFFNRSFAVTDKELLVINPYFPFISLQSFKFEDVQKVTISSRDNKIWIPFGIFGECNYVEVVTKNFVSEGFYCFFLQTDYIDDDSIENTVDYLHLCLKSNGVNVNWMLN